MFVQVQISRCGIVFQSYPHKVHVKIWHQITNSRVNVNYVYNINVVCQSGNKRKLKKLFETAEKYLNKNYFKKSYKKST